MRFLLTIVIGAVIGFLAGIATPILMYGYYRLTESGPDGGVGTVYAYMLLLTVPGFTALGTIIGTIVGALRD